MIGIFFLQYKLFDYHKVFKTLSGNVFSSTITHMKISLKFMKKYNILPHPRTDGWPIGLRTDGRVGQIQKSFDTKLRKNPSVTTKLEVFSHKIHAIRLCSRLYHSNFIQFFNNLFSSWKESRTKWKDWIQIHDYYHKLVVSWPHEIQFCIKDTINFIQSD